VLALGGLVTAPYALPLLPVEMLPGYLQVLGIQEVRPETRRMGNVPQLFADMLGWEDLVAETARIYHALPADERARAVVWGLGYGPAAAIDHLGAAHGLPKAISGHQNYFLWGPGERGDGEVVIALGFRAESLRPWFDSLELAGQIRCPYCMPDRVEQPIYVGRALKMPLRELWPQTKCWTCDAPEFLRSGGNGV
jgi:hypothetical protein